MLEEAPEGYNPDIVYLRTDSVKYASVTGFETGSLVWTDAESGVSCNLTINEELELAFSGNCSLEWENPAPYYYEGEFSGIYGPGSEPYYFSVVGGNDVLSGVESIFYMLTISGNEAMIEFTSPTIAIFTYQNASCNVIFSEDYSSI